MAHMMKHTKAACGHMFAHYDRTANNISNENIDRTKTHMNYNLAANQTKRQGDFVKQRCSEVRCQNRKDVNVMVSWVATVPKGLPDDEHELFLRTSYDFLRERYGDENVVSAYVHMDESMPHLHFAFVPVTEDTRRGDYKVSAKEVISRRELQVFHQDLDKRMTEVFGRDIGILNEATKSGNKEVAELKLLNRNIILKKINIHISEAKKELDKVKSEIQAERAQKADLERKIGPLKEEFDKLLDECDIALNETLYEKFVEQPEIKPMWESYRECQRDIYWPNMLNMVEFIDGDDYQPYTPVSDYYDGDIGDSIFARREAAIRNLDKGFEH